VAVGEGAPLPDALDGDDELGAARDGGEHLLKLRVLELGGVHAARAQLFAQARDRVGAAVVHVRDELADAALDDQRVVVDVELQRLFERDAERLRPGLGVRDLPPRDGQGTRRDDLLRQVVKV